MTKLLDSNDVADILGVCSRQATNLMLQMVHIDIGTGKKRILRVTEDALTDWLNDKTVSVRPTITRMPRKKGGKIIAV